MAYTKCIKTQTKSPKVRASLQDPHYELKKLLTAVNSDSPLKDWSKQESKDLLQALKTHGRYDIEKMQECINTKNFYETKKVIDYYIERALRHPIMTLKLMEMNPKRAMSKL